MNLWYSNLESVFGRGRGVCGDAAAGGACSGGAGVSVAAATAEDSGTRRAAMTPAGCTATANISATMLILL